MTDFPLTLALSPQAGRGNTPSLPASGAREHSLSRLGGRGAPERGAGPRLRDATVKVHNSTRISGALHPAAGAGATRSRGPACGDATVEPAMSASLPSLCASSRSDPQRGPSSALRRAHPSASRWNLFRPPRARGEGGASANAAIYGWHALLRSLIL